MNQLLEWIRRRQRKEHGTESAMRNVHAKIDRVAAVVQQQKQDSAETGNMLESEWFPVPPWKAPAPKRKGHL